MLSELVVGECYEVKTKDFKRPFVGKVTDVREDYVLVEVKHCELIDQEKFNPKSLVKAQPFDVKRLVGENCFFS